MSNCGFEKMIDINSLDRFVAAQEKLYETALSEIKQGKKRTHWMWFVFPQLRALGQSQRAYTYGISGKEEAVAYLAHPILSIRLREICGALLEHKDKSAYSIFGDIDEMKLKSSMTLFAFVSDEGSVFHRVLDAFYNGEQDTLTMDLLNK